MVSVEAVRGLLIFFPIFLLSLSIHEWAHAWVANRLGDPTARMSGRLTVNPIAHADPMGTIVFPLLVGLFNVPLFGWAKPVPVDQRNFSNPKRHMAFVSAAGPGANILLAVFCAAVGGFLESWSYRAALTSGGDYNTYVLTLVKMLQTGVGINLFLAVFNLIPVGPLDGAKVLHLFVPTRKLAKVEEWQHMGGTILMSLVFLSWVLPQFNVFRFLAVPVMWGSHVLLNLFSF